MQLDEQFTIRIGLGKAGRGFYQIGEGITYVAFNTEEAKEQAAQAIEALKHLPELLEDPEVREVLKFMIEEAIKGGWKEFLRSPGWKKRQILYQIIGEVALAASGAQVAKLSKAQKLTQFLQRISKLRVINRARGVANPALKRKILGEIFDERTIERLMERGIVCFVAGTQVLTPDGCVNIEDVKIGDLVYSKNEKTGECGFQEVLQLFVTNPTELVHLRYQSEDGDAAALADSATLSGTAEHPVWSEDRQDWTPIGHLCIGERIQLRDGARARVLALDREAAPDGQSFTTYNVEVANWHTYFVAPTPDALDSHALWVHNMGRKCKTIKSRPHRNKTEGHWEAILDEVDNMAQSGDYTTVYANKGLAREVPGIKPNRRPDVWGVRNDGLIDQVEVPSKTDVVEDLIERMQDTQRLLGDRAGKIKIVPPKPGGGG